MLWLVAALLSSTMPADNLPGSKLQIKQQMPRVRTLPKVFVFEAGAVPGNCEVIAEVPVEPQSSMQFAAAATTKAIRLGGNAIQPISHSFPVKSGNMFKVMSCIFAN